MTPGRIIKLIRVFVCVFGVVLPPSSFAGQGLVWKDCLREAAKYHPDLISAEEVIVQAKDSQWATASGLMPQVTGNLSVSRQTSGGNTSSNQGDFISVGSSTSSKARDQYSYNLSATQLIFDDFKTVYNVKGAGQNVWAKKEVYRFTSVSIRFRLRSAFIDLLKAQAAIGLYEDIIRIRKSSYDLIKLRYESGIEHKGALMQAAANLAQAEFYLAQAHRNVVVAQRKLAKEMGLINNIDIGADGTFDIKEALSPKPDLEIITKKHPSVVQLEYQKSQAEYAVKSAISSFWPQVTGQGALGKADSNWPPANDQWNIGFAVTVPIFEGGLQLAQLAQAKSSLKQTIATEQSTHDSVITTLESSWAALLDATETVTVQEKLLLASNERSRISEAQYSIGLMTFDNWIIIEDNLVQAKKSFLDAQASALLAEAQWIQAKGETLEYED